MPKPSVYQDAKALADSLLKRHPAGVTVPRAAWDRLLITSPPGRSETSADRLTRTGEKAGLWVRKKAQAGNEGWVVEVKPQSFLDSAST